MVVEAALSGCVLDVLAEESGVCGGERVGDEVDHLTNVKLDLLSRDVDLKAFRILLKYLVKVMIVPILTSS